MTGATLPLTACAQTPPEVVDSYPKQRLKERAEEARRAEEAARAAEEAARAAEEAARIEREAALAPPPVIQPVAFNLPEPSSPLGMEMVVIQPGQGQLGSPPHELKRARFENPMQTTFIDYVFEVGKYEITFDDWDKCVAGGGCKGYRPKDGGWGKGRRPVINISFDDAQSYLTWLNNCLLYTSPSPRDKRQSRMPSSA